MVLQAIQWYWMAFSFAVYSYKIVFFALHGLTLGGSHPPAEVCCLSEVVGKPRRIFRGSKSE